MEEFSHINKSEQLLKNLNAVLNYSIERYSNQFLWQDIKLNDTFKELFEQFLLNKGMKIFYLENTSIITSSRNEQHIFVANQWFAIGSYFVDFCTELLTYRDYYNEICERLGKIGRKSKCDYAVTLRTAPSISDKNKFVTTAQAILSERFNVSHDELEKAVSYLWRFVSDYSWWAGSKTIDRGDFHISPILSGLNVVNANAEFLAEIVYFYASDLGLRLIVENLEGFTIDAKTKKYMPSEIEKKSYEEAEHITFKQPSVDCYSDLAISISTASLERFKSEMR